MKRKSKTTRSFAIVPAAGRSRRMGQDKLLMPWGDATVIESLLAAWRASCVDATVVVVRSDQSELLALCSDASVVVPETAPPEMKDSVLAALNHIRGVFLPNDGDVWLLAPADMPQLSSMVIDSLIAAHDPSRPRIMVPFCNGKRGHPVLFPWATAQAVGELGKDEGVNALLEQFSVAKVDVDDATVHGDLDTPEDYERLWSRSESHAEAQRRRDN